MKDYLEHTFDPEDPQLVSVIDELPLWSAPFGLKLLETIKLKAGIHALDIGCGLGFPLIEVAQRLGNTSKVYGIDPWESVINRVNLKIQTYKLKNIVPVKGYAENLPFEDNFFDLIVSNNGINNVEDIHATLSECHRVSKPGAQFVLTMNLPETMIEFYTVFEKVLLKNGLNAEIEKMKEQIYLKRKPLDETKSSLSIADFKIKNVIEDSFELRFLDAATMFEHYLIKYWFLDGWKKIIGFEKLESIFNEIEIELNQISRSKGEIALTIPYVTIDCTRN